MVCVKQISKIENHFEIIMITLEITENSVAPFQGKKKCSKILDLLYSKEPALHHGFNAAIGKLIQVCGDEISFEKCQILTVWFS